MFGGMPSPAHAIYWSIPGWVLFIIIPLLGVTSFAFIVAKRLAPLLGAERDCRLDRPLLRLQKVLQYWLLQWKQPRYWLAGVLHIAIFLAKVLCVMFGVIWVRWMWPRFRYDQLMDLGWRRFIPLALANIIVTAVVLWMKS